MHEAKEEQMPALRIRRGVLSDAPGLAAFAARTFCEAFAADNNPEDLRKHLAASYGIRQQGSELTDPDVATLLAHRDDALIAYAQVRRRQPPSCVTQSAPIEVQRFYVDRPAHGTGVARLLMLAAFDAAKAFSGEHVWLSAWERNARGLAFYARMGFVDVGGADFFVGNDRQSDRILVARIPD